MCVRARIACILTCPLNSWACGSLCLLRDVGPNERDLGEMNKDTRIHKVSVLSWTEFNSKMILCVKQSVPNAVGVGIVDGWLECSTTV